MFADFHLSPLRDPRDQVTEKMRYSKESLVSKCLMDEVGFPEGGGKAWLVVFGSWCALFSSLGIMNTMGAFQEHISSHQLQHLDVSIVGWIFSLYAFLTFGVGLFVGPVFDTYGPRYLVISGSILVVLSMTLVGYCTELWHFIMCFSILGGVGSALLFSPSIAIVGHYFNKRRGTATGIATTGGAFGGIVYPLILQVLIPKIGFSWTTKVIAGISLMLCLFANIFIKGRLPPSPDANARPDIRILARPAFATTVLGVFLLEFALFVPLTYVTSYSLAQGFSPTFSFLVLPILNLGSVFGRWLPGFIADKIGRFNTAVIAIILTVAAVLGVWLPVGNTKPGLVIFALLFGFASGSNISLTPVCVSQLCSIENYGRYYSTCFSIVSLGCLTGVPIAGRILDVGNGSYGGLIFFVGLVYAGGLIAFLWARLIATGLKLGVKY
ncbi:Riboflavin transporter [Lachnellula hyalina]|uniref:Riboflavin transporter n=1 Tax=Lachnellula hyalina TaxID=1316788 RepID=A0A8H8U4H4_9HELO|nr:Riboflavin transporter [Lachnellula hyalina]TVY31135.1 Riboflavin transporter [Lachnellula hyalina]